MRATPATPAHLRSQRFDVLERRLSELAAAGQGMSTEEVAFQARVLRGILGEPARNMDAHTAEAVDIAARTKVWLESGGRQQLEAALAEVDREIERWREATRLDWRTLMEPCTI